MKSRNWLTNIGLLALLSFGYGCQNPQIDRIDINGKSAYSGGYPFSISGDIRSVPS